MASEHVSSDGEIEEKQPSNDSPSESTDVVNSSLKSGTAATECPDEKSNGDASGSTTNDDMGNDDGTDSKEAQNEDVQNNSPENNTHPGDDMTYPVSKNSETAVSGDPETKKTPGDISDAENLQDANVDCENELQPSVTSSCDKNSTKPILDTRSDSKTNDQDVPTPVTDTSNHDGGSSVAFTSVAVTSDTVSGDATTKETITSDADVVDDAVCQETKATVENNIETKSSKVVSDEEQKPLCSEKPQNSEQCSIDSPGSDFVDSAKNDNEQTKDSNKDNQVVEPEVMETSKDVKTECQPIASENGSQDVKVNADESADKEIEEAPPLKSASGKSSVKEKVTKSVVKLTKVAKSKVTPKAGKLALKAKAKKDTTTAEGGKCKKELPAVSADSKGKKKADGKKASEKEVTPEASITTGVTRKKSPRKSSEPRKYVRKSVKEEKLETPAPDRSPGRKAMEKPAAAEEKVVGRKRKSESPKPSKAAPKEKYSKSTKEQVDVTNNGGKDGEQKKVEKAANTKKKEAVPEKKKEAANDKKKEAANDKKKEAANEKKKETANDRKKEVANEKKKEAANEKKKEAANDRKKETATDQKKSDKPGKKNVLKSEKLRLNTNKKLDDVNKTKDKSDTTADLKAAKKSKKLSKSPEKKDVKKLADLKATKKKSIVKKIAKSPVRKKVAEPKTEKSSKKGTILKNKSSTDKTYDVKNADNGNVISDCDVLIGENDTVRNDLEKKGDCGHLDDSAINVAVKVEVIKKEDDTSLDDSNETIEDVSEQSDAESLKTVMKPKHTIAKKDKKSAKLKSNKHAAADTSIEKVRTKSKSSESKKQLKDTVSKHSDSSASKSMDIYEYDDEPETVIPPKRTKFKVDGTGVANSSLIGDSGIKYSVSTESSDSDSTINSTIKTPHRKHFDEYLPPGLPDRDVSTDGLPDVDVTTIGTSRVEDILLSKPMINRGEGNFPCVKCEFLSKRKVVTRKHQFSHQVYQCLYCDYDCGSLDGFYSHGADVHPKKPGLRTCTKCCLLVRMGDDYRAHVEGCSGKSSVTCNHCGKDFRYEFRLKTHIQKTHSDLEGVLPQYPCDRCDYQADTHGQLLKHQNTHLDFPCKHCDEVFPTKALLRKHQVIHAHLRPFVCKYEFCQRGFKSQHDVNVHESLHTDERPHICGVNECSDAFKTSKACEQHRNEVHQLTEKQLQCQHEGCDQKFYKMPQLRRHENKHNPNRQFSCDWDGCNKAFRHADNLRVHYMQHTNEKPFACELCDFACRQKSSWQWHMAKKHPDDDYKPMARRRVGIVKAMPQMSDCDGSYQPEKQPMPGTEYDEKNWMQHPEPYNPCYAEKDKIGMHPDAMIPGTSAPVVGDDATTADVNKAIDQVLAEHMGDQMDHHGLAADPSSVMDSSMSDGQLPPRPQDSPNIAGMPYPPGGGGIHGSIDPSGQRQFNDNTQQGNNTTVNKTPDHNMDGFAPSGDSKNVSEPYGPPPGHHETGYMDNQSYPNTYNPMLPHPGNSMQGQVPPTGPPSSGPQMDPSICDPIKALERISNSTVPNYKQHGMEMPYPKNSMESPYGKHGMDSPFNKPGMDSPYMKHMENNSYPGTPNMSSNPPSIPPYTSADNSMSHPHYPPSVTVPTDSYGPTPDMGQYHPPPPQEMMSHPSYDPSQLPNQPPQSAQTHDANTIKPSMMSPHDGNNITHPLMSPAGNMDHRRNSGVSQDGRPDNIYDAAPPSNISNVPSVQSDPQRYDGAPPSVPDQQRYDGAPPSVPDQSRYDGAPPSVPDQQRYDGAPPSVPDQQRYDGAPPSVPDQPRYDGAPPSVPDQHRYDGAPPSVPDQPRYDGAPPSVPDQQRYDGAPPSVPEQQRYDGAPPSVPDQQHYDGAPPSVPDQQRYDGAPPSVSDQPRYDGAPPSVPDQPRYDGAPPSVPDQQRYDGAPPSVTDQPRYDGAPPSVPDQQRYDGAPPSVPDQQRYDGPPPSVPDQHRYDGAPPSVPDQQRYDGAPPSVPDQQRYDGAPPSVPDQQRYDAAPPSVPDQQRYDGAPPSANDQPRYEGGPGSVPNVPSVPSEGAGMDINMASTQRGDPSSIDSNIPSDDVTTRPENPVEPNNPITAPYQTPVGPSSHPDQAAYPGFYPPPVTTEDNRDTIPSQNTQFDGVMSQPTSTWHPENPRNLPEKTDGLKDEKMPEDSIMPAGDSQAAVSSSSGLFGTGYPLPHDSASSLGAPMPDAANYMGYPHPQDPLSSRGLSNLQDPYRSSEYLRRGYPGSEFLNPTGQSTSQSWMGGAYSNPLTQPPILPPPSSDLSSSLSKEPYNKDSYPTPPANKDSYLYDKDYSKRVGSSYVPGREGMSMFNDPMTGHPYDPLAWGRYQQAAASNSSYSRLPSAATQKGYDDPYYRSLQAPPTPDMLSRMGMPPLGLDKYYYPRDSMYRSPHNLSPFIPQTGSPQSDYRAGSMYSQQYPFMGSGAHKFPQGVPGLPDRPVGSEYYGAAPPPAAGDTRSMFYHHMMNRPF